MSDELRALARQILEIAPLVMRTVSAELRQSDHFLATSHFRVLWILEHHPQTLSELAEKLMVSLPTMSNSITILEERGWVTRTRSAEDRRKVLIEIAPAGRDVLAMVRDQTETRVAEIIHVLDAEERDKVSAGLTILRDAFVTANAFSHSCEVKRTREGV